MTARSLVRKTLSLVLLAALTACGGFGFRQPEVTLEGVTLGGLGLRGGTLLVNLRIRNPNAFSLGAERLHYDLAVRNPEAQGDSAWLDFAQGTFDERFTVGAGDTETVQVPVEFTYAGLGGAGSSVLRSGSFTYRASGRVEVRTPLGIREVPFTRRGTVTMSGTR